MLFVLASLLLLTAHAWVPGAPVAGGKSSITLEEVPAFRKHQEMMFTASQTEELVETLTRRLAVKDEFYSDCVFWINALRAREGLPALKRWTEKEACSDQMSKNDQKVNIAHHGFANSLPNKQCLQGMGAQNTCPDWNNDIDSNRRCTIAMWDEKIDVIRGSTLSCKPGKQCGHYYSLRGGQSGYNRYDKVACGFSLNGDKLWINQNFGFSENKFKCAGGVEMKPKSVLESDCSTAARANKYGDCDEDYNFWGCHTKDCDPSFKGDCVDHLVNGSNIVAPGKGTGQDICKFFDLTFPCDQSQRITTNNRDWVHTTQVCRKTCQNCGCSGKPSKGRGSDGKPSTGGNKTDNNKNNDNNNKNKNNNNKNNNNKNNKNNNSGGGNQSQGSAVKCSTIKEKTPCNPEDHCVWKKRKCVLDKKWINATKRACKKHKKDVNKCSDDKYCTPKLNKKGIMRKCWIKDIFK